METMGSISKKAKFRPLVSALACMAVVALPGLAQANLSPTVTAVYGSMVPGAHTDYTVNHSYSSAGYSNFPAQAPPTGEVGMPGSMDDLKRWALDSPAGLVGNPNAVPFADRCTPAQFNQASFLAAATCPASSIVGSATLTVGYDYSGGTAATLSGSIYILQTEPEVPTTLATQITAGAIDPRAGCSSPAVPLLGPPSFIKTQSVIGPVTNGDFRLRTTSQEDATRSTLAKNFSGLNVCINGHIKGIQQHLFGLAPNGNAFLTNPTRCDKWDTYLYGKAYDSNTNADADPNQTGTNDFVRSPADSQTPDCSTLPAFAPTASEVLSTYKRDTAPVASFNIVDPAVPGVSVPRKVVTTFPKTLSVNGAAIPLLCTTAEAAARTCPASSSVGSVSVQTALVSVPLTGSVFAVQNTTNQLPDLLVHVKDPRAGGLDFWVQSTSTLVDSKVITTFNDLPQVGFNKFALTIDAGTTGFLKIRKCPDSAARPEDGPIVYDMTSWAGQASTVSNSTPFAECVGINKLPKPSKCVYHSLNVSPTYASRLNMTKAELFIDGTRVNTNKKDRFEWNWNVDDYASGKHDLKVRNFYKSGKKDYKKISWSKC